MLIRETKTGNIELEGDTPEVDSRHDKRRFEVKDDEQQVLGSKKCQFKHYIVSR